MRRSSSGLTLTCLFSLSTALAMHAPRGVLQQIIATFEAFGIAQPVSKLALSVLVSGVASDDHNSSWYSYMLTLEFGTIVS